MAADLYIHVFENGQLTDADFRAFFGNVLGSKWFSSCHVGSRYMQVYAKMHDLPNHWVGEVSWLKASLLEGGEEDFIPGPVQRISDIIGEDCPVVDDNLIEQCAAAMEVENKTAYRLTTKEEVVAFLEGHRGKKAFTISW